MTDSSIQLPTAGSGPSLDCEELTIGGVIVQRQRIQIASASFLLEQNFSRPADTTAYAAGDAVTNSTSSPSAITFASAARFNGGGGIIRGAQLINSVNAGTKGQFELWLFNGPAAPTPDNDNTAFTPTDAELLKLVGKIVFHSNNAFVGDAASNAIYDGTLSNGADASRELNIRYVCDSTITSLFGLVVVRNAYTPTSAENYAFRLCAERD